MCKLRIFRWRDMRQISSRSGMDEVILESDKNRLKVKDERKIEVLNYFVSERSIILHAFVESMCEQHGTIGYQPIFESSFCNTLKNTLLHAKKPNSCHQFHDSSISHSSSITTPQGCCTFPNMISLSLSLIFIAISLLSGRTTSTPR
jgi:hypothetical protein